MDDQRREEAPVEIAEEWASVRRVREPVAWMLLILTGVGVLIDVWLLFGLPGSPTIGAPVTSGPGNGTPGPATTFAFRAANVAPQFVAITIITLPVLSVILVAFTGGLTGRARQVVQTAILVQSVAFVLGVLSLVAAGGAHDQPGIWFVAVARDLAVTAVALIFTGAVLRSRALRSQAPQFQDLPEDDDEFGEDDDFGEDDEDWASPRADR